MGYTYIIRERMKQRHKELLEHETKRHSLWKFIFLLIIVAAYFWFVAEEYGAHYGLAITAITWSFFVMCTPIADAGFLIDFPIRVVADIRMTYTEIAVWIAALGINAYALLYAPEIYEKTFILMLFQHILVTPYPFWGIIILSAVGTFLSIYFGDELMDVVSYNERTEHAKHKLKHDFILFIFVIIAVIALYDFLLKELEMEIPF